jgi:hypothetical protein
MWSVGEAGTMAYSHGRDRFIDLPCSADGPCLYPNRPGGRGSGTVWRLDGAGGAYLA